MRDVKITIDITQIIFLNKYYSLTIFSVISEKRELCLDDGNTLASTGKANFNSFFSNSFSIDMCNWFFAKDFF